MILLFGRKQEHLCCKRLGLKLSVFFIPTWNNFRKHQFIILQALRSACLCVYMSIGVLPYLKRLNVYTSSIFLCMMPMAVAQSLSGNSAIKHYVFTSFMDNVMFSDDGQA